MKGVNQFADCKGSTTKKQTRHMMNQAQNGDANPPEFSHELFCKRVAAVAKLVETYRENGVAEFKTLATRIAERFPEKFDAMKPFLPDVWNAVARASNLPRVSDVEVTEIYKSITSKQSAFHSDCMYDLDERIRYHEEWLQKWKRKHPNLIQKKDKDVNRPRTLAKTIVRIIGAIVIPFFAAWAILLMVKFFVVIGKWTTNEYSDFPMTPWKAVIILAIGELLAGHTIAYVAHELAPKAKLFMAIFVVLLYAALLGFFIQHYCDIAIGIIGATVFVVRTYRKSHETK